MYKSSILAAMSAARQQVGQSAGVPGHMRRASILTVLDGRPGGPGQFWQIFADGMFLSHVSFYS